MKLQAPALAVALCLFAAAAVASSPSPAAAQTKKSPSRTGEGPHVRVELIADRETPGPGLSLGVRFELDPKWHIYWQNPGDSGGPPQVAWTFPAGLTAKGLEWPAPERIDIGGLFNYGYHDEVVLPVQVSAAAGARIPADLMARASLRWLACADMCVPGKAELELRFPLSTQERTLVAGWNNAIAAARRQVPKVAPSSWSATARSTRDSFIVEVVTGSRETSAVFFPLEISQVNDSAAQVVTPLDKGLRLTLRKSDQLVKDPEHLSGVLSLAGGRSYVVSAPLLR
jgi:thiol:disulfide interchange protein DsbD